MSERARLADGGQGDGVGVDEVVDHVVTAGLLTERQAQVYVRRDLLDLGRPETAEDLGISISMVDDHLSVARGKVERARETVERLDALDAVIDAPTAHGRRRDE